MTASKQFVAVSFSQGQLLDVDTMNQLSNNTVYLRDQMVDGKYQFDWGGVVDTQIKLLAGRFYVPADGGTEPHYGICGFPALFTPGCQPIITTSILSPGECKFEHVVYGIGTYFPDHRGFIFKIKINPAYAKGSFDNPLYLQYHAVGY